MRFVFSYMSGTANQINSGVNLTASTVGVTGNYKWPTGAATPDQGTINNGLITQSTIAISGIEQEIRPLVRFRYDE